MIGQTIAHYRVTAKLGQGGMGAVYRATDTKLEREVAIKVLPDSFIHDPQRLVRFEREAKALAALSHPNIAGIYGLEKTEDSQALILELVEGEDLSDRLKRGPLPVDEALEVCKQIAEALEAAHEKGIIHRDLKPGNIKLLPDGRVKVLDFGLAKVVSDAPSTVEGNTGLEDSPTVFTKGNATMPGVLLGTAGYMSPEQARGKPVDKRSDIWSFGVVLFECLTGERLFPGETVTDSVGALLHKEIVWNLLPPGTPPVIHLLLRKCLARDRKRRLRDIGDAIVDLEQAIADPSSSFIRLSGDALRETKSGKGIPRLAVAALVGVVAIVAVAVGWFLKPAPQSASTSSPVRRVEVGLGVGSNLRSPVKFSPDASMLAFVAASADDAGTSQLYVRKLNQLAAAPLPNARNVSYFCWSPDGREIAFHDYSGNSLKTVRVDGGEALTWCAADSCMGMDWSKDVGIVFAKVTGGLLLVSGPGAKPVELTTVSDGDVTHRWPHIIPGGQAVLFTAANGIGLSEGDGDIRVVRLSDGKTTPVLHPGTDARYINGGHLVFVREGKLFGVGFNIHSLMATGPAVTVAEKTAIDFDGQGYFDMSRDGDLVYPPEIEREIGQESRFSLAWVDREGKREIVGQSGFYGGFRISSDGDHVSYHSSDDSRGQTWIYDLRRGIPNQLTRRPGAALFPVWSPDGEFVVVGGSIDDSPSIRWMRADGSGGAHLLMTNQSTLFPVAWHPDGRHLLIYKESSEPSPEMRVMGLELDDQSGWKAGKEQDLEPIPGHEDDGDFSRDGKWVAYDSSPPGDRRSQIYVRPFQGGGARIPVSLPDVPCHQVAFSRAADELLIGAVAEPGGWRRLQIYVVKYSVDDTGRFNPQPPFPWTNGITEGTFDLAPDGKRVLVRTLVDLEKTDRADRVVLVENFLTELREKVPSGKK